MYNQFPFLYTNHKTYTFLISSLFQVPFFSQDYLLRMLCNKDAVTPKNTTPIKNTLSFHKDPKSSWRLSRLNLHRL